MERIPRTTADEFCQKLKPQAKPIYVRDSQVKGLVLRVMPTGSKSWIFCYTAPCPKKKWRERRKGLGPFRYGRNDTAGLSVPSARREAEREFDRRIAKRVNLKTEIERSVCVSYGLLVLGNKYWIGTARASAGLDPGGCAVDENENKKGGL